LLLGAGGFKAGFVELHTGIASRIHHEVERQAEGFVKVEGFFARNPLGSKIECSEQF
jgi:hypothetical protein